MKYKPGDKVEVRGRRKEDGWFPARFLQKGETVAAAWVRVFFAVDVFRDWVISTGDIRPRQEPADAT